MKWFLIYTPCRRNYRTCCGVGFVGVGYSGGMMPTQNWSIEKKQRNREAMWRYFPSGLVLDVRAWVWSVLTCCSLSSDTVRFVLKEKSCATASQCGISGEKRTAGLVFTYTTRCCDTDLCNSAAPPSTPCWSRTALSLSVTALTVLLASLWNHKHRQHSMLSVH